MPISPSVVRAMTLITTDCQENGRSVGDVDLKSIQAKAKVSPDEILEAQVRLLAEQPDVALQAFVRGAKTLGLQPQAPETDRVRNLLPNGGMGDIHSVLGRGRLPDLPLTVTPESAELLRTGLAQHSSRVVSSVAPTVDDLQVPTFRHVRLDPSVMETNVVARAALADARRVFAHNQVSFASAYNNILYLTLLSENSDALTEGLDEYLAARWPPIQQAFAQATSVYDAVKGACARGATHEQLDTLLERFGPIPMGIQNAMIRDISDPELRAALLSVCDAGIRDAKDRYSTMADGMFHEWDARLIELLKTTPAPKELSGLRGEERSRIDWIVLEHAGNVVPDLDSSEGHFPASIDSTVVAARLRAFLRRGLEVVHERLGKEKHFTRKKMDQDGCYPGRIQHLMFGGVQGAEQALMRLGTSSTVAQTRDKISVHPHDAAKHLATYKSLIMTTLYDRWFHEEQGHGDVTPEVTREQFDALMRQFRAYALEQLAEFRIYLPDPRVPEGEGVMQMRDFTDDDFRTFISGGAEVTYDITEAPVVDSAALSVPALSQTDLPSGFTVEEVAEARKTGENGLVALIGQKLPGASNRMTRHAAARAISTALARAEMFDGLNAMSFQTKAM